MKEMLLYLGIICFIVLYYVSPISIDITIHDNNKVLTKEINTSMTKTKDELLAEAGWVKIPKTDFLLNKNSKKVYFDTPILKKVYQDIFKDPSLFTKYLEINNLGDLGRFIRNRVEANLTRYGLDSANPKFVFDNPDYEGRVADNTNGLHYNPLLELLGEPTYSFNLTDEVKNNILKFYTNGVYRNKEKLRNQYMNIMGKSSEDFEKFYNDALGWSEEIPSSNELNYEKLKPYIPKPEAKEALEDELKQYYETTPEKELGQYYETMPEEELEQYYEEEPIQEPSLSISNAQPSPIKYFDASNYQIVQSPEQSLALDNRLAEIAKKRLVDQVLNEPKMGDGTIMQQLARLYENNNKRASRFMDRNFTN